MLRTPVMNHKNFPFALITGTIIGVGVALFGQRKPVPQYGPFVPLGKAFQYDWSYPLWGGVGTIAYRQTTRATPGSWSLVIINPTGLVQHSDFSREEDARRVFASLSPLLSLTDQQGRFVRWGDLSASLYDPNGNSIATKIPGPSAR